MNVKKSQNLLEYALILALVAVVGAAIVSKFDFKLIKNYIFNHTADPADKSKIKIEAMTK